MAITWKDIEVLVAARLGESVEEARTRVKKWKQRRKIPGDWMLRLLEDRPHLSQSELAALASRGSERRLSCR
jgi:hypothetical protein